MAARVNTKFVSILVGLLVLVVLAGMGMVYYSGHRNPVDYIARGDTAMAAGHVEMAVQEYQRAVNRRPSDVALLIKLADAQSAIALDDPRAARTYLTNVLRGYQSATQLEPNNPAPLQRLFTAYLTLGEEGDVTAWDVMLGQAQSALARNPEMVVARKYRGIAQVARSRKLEISPVDHETSRKDLLVARKADGDDQATVRYLAEWDLSEIQRLERPGGDKNRADQLRKEARQLVADAQAAHPEDLRRRIDYCRVVRALGDAAEANRVLAELEADLLKQPENNLMIGEVAQLILGFDPASGQQALPAEAIKRAERLVRAGVKASPDDIRLQMLLGHLLSRNEPPVESMEIFKKIGQTQFHGTAIELLRTTGVANMAMLRYCDLLLNQAEMPDLAAAERDKRMAEVNSLIERLNMSEIGHSGPVNLLEGRVALLKGQWRLALTKLDLASANFNHLSPDTLLYAARACIQLNELGAAIIRLKRITELVPSFLQARYELAQLYLRSNQAEEALRQLAVVLKLKPDDETAQMMQASALSQLGRPQDAIAVLTLLKPEERTNVALMLARLQVAQGQSDKARQLLDRRLNADPKDARVLMTLLPLVEDVEQKKRYLDLSRQAGGDPRAIEMLSLELEDPKSAPERIEAFLQSEKDPLERHLKLFQFYRQIGRGEPASAELAEAAKLSPDHATVIDAQFDDALLTKSWDKAVSLAGRANKLNLDQADGMFYQGRLDLARGRYDAAVASFSRGLAAQPVYSTGWRFKGDAMRLNGDLPGAVTAYENALEQLPTNLDALRGLALAHDGLGRYDQALAIIRRAYQIGPNDPDITAQYLAYEQEHGDRAQVLSIRRRTAQSNPKNTVNRRLLALLLARMNQRAEALKIADALLAEEPDSTPNVVAAAAVRQITGTPEEGRKLFQDYVQRKGDKAALGDWTALGQFLMNMGEQSGAIAAYKQAISMEDPKARPASRELADVLFDRNEFPQAAELYQQLCASQPGDRNLTLRCAESLVRSSRFDAAEQQLARLESSQGEDSTTLLLRAMIARSRNDRAKALALLNRAAERSPGRLNVYIERAMLQSNDPSKTNETVADLQKVLELSPNHVVARRMLADRLAVLGENDEAIRQLLRVIERNPRDTEARRQLVEVYLHAKQLVPLRQFLITTAKLFPQDPIWLRLQAKVEMMQSKPDPIFALQKLNEAYKLSKTAPVLLELVQLLVDLKRPTTALELLRGQPEMLEQIPMLRALQGRALFATKQTETGTAAFAKGVELCQNYQQVGMVAAQMAQAMGTPQTIAQLQLLSYPPRKLWVEMTIAQFETDAKDYKAAVSRLKQVEPLVFHGSDVEKTYLKMLAIGQYQSGNLEGAVDTYRAMLQVAPDDPETLNNLAYLLADDLHRASEALPLAEKAAKLISDSAPVLDTLGWVQFQAGAKDQAYDTLRRSVDKQNLPSNNYHLAEVLLTRGQKTYARELLNSAQRLAEQSNDPKILELATRRLKDLGP